MLLRFVQGLPLALAGFILCNVKASGGENPPVFSSFQEAQRFAREQIRLGMTKDLTVHLRHGTIFIDEPVVFTAADSPPDGRTITFRSAPGGTTTLSGSRSIPFNRWEEWKAGIYRTKWPSTIPVSVLFERGEYGFPARHPNNGYFRLRGIASGNTMSRNSFGFETGDIPHLSSPTEVEVKVWPGGPEGEWAWKIQKRTISSIDLQKRTIHMSRNVPLQLGTGSLYYLQNALEFLDAPGEFYHDRNAGYLYYLPRTLPIKVEVPILSTVIHIEGDSKNRVVQGLRFEGIFITSTSGDREIRHYSGSAAIYINNAKDIELRDCRISNTGGHGIFLDSYASEVTINGCHLHAIGRNGISIKGPNGWASKEPTRNRENVISRNVIHDVGRKVESSHGIWIYQSSENRISKNKIFRTPRSSITLEAPTASRQLGKLIDGVKVTKENVKDTILNVNNIIEYNDLSHAVLEGQDCGIIYHCGSSRETKIRNNRLHNSEIPYSYGFGIYLDNDSTNVLIENNIIHDLQKRGGGDLYGVIATKGSGHIIRRNIIANNRIKNGIIYSHRMMEDEKSVSRNLVIEKNIFYNNEFVRDKAYIYWFNQWSDDRIKKSENNVIYPDGKYFVKGVHGKVLNWSQWQDEMNFDRNSMMIDPRFVDPKTGDYRLKNDTIRKNLEIQDIDQGHIHIW
jgi:hypothetical protein